ncbi:hypothetical protein ASG07_15370 [Sphingomonas sp. Leaf343]|nr:hypothetical protein ASG07_15370 [Sphingomonas sp. Leaf343]
MMAAILEERVEVTVAGRTRRMTLKEAGLRQLANDFAYGPTLQRRKTLEALFRIGALDAVAAPQDHSIPEERIEAFIQQLAAEALSDQEREEWMRENGLARPVDNPVS